MNKRKRKTHPLNWLYCKRWRWKNHEKVCAYNRAYNATRRRAKA